MQTAALEAFFLAAGSVLAVSPFVLVLLIDGYMAMRSKADVVYAFGFGMVAAGAALAVEITVIVLVFG